MLSSRAQTNPLSDRELVQAFSLGLRSVYADITRQPLPEDFAPALQQLERRSAAVKGKAPSGRTAPAGQGRSRRT